MAQRPKQRAEPVDPMDPAARARPDPYRRIVRLKGEKSQLPGNPEGPSGPTRDRKAALIEARERQAGKRKSRAKSRGRLDGDDRVVADTQANYLRCGKALFARYSRQIGSHIRDEDVDPADLVNWLFGLRPTLSASSWRVYRRSILMFVQSIPHSNRESAVASLEADVGAGEDAHQGRRRGRPVGPAKSEGAKRWARSDFDKVMKEIGKLSRSKAIPWLQDWMAAGISTGLLPSDWAMTDLEVRIDDDRKSGRRAWLHVVKAPADAAGSAIVRTLDISDFSEPAFNAVRHMVERAEEWSRVQKYERRQSQCAQLLYKVCRTLFPRQKQRYSLVSLHHQFIANMSSIYQPAEVAALVGHLVASAASLEHYGKRRAAWLKDEICEVPVPMPKEVMKMQWQWELYQQQRLVKELRKARNKRRREKVNATKAKLER